MKQLICTICGGEVALEGDMLLCQYCGAKYAAETPAKPEPMKPAFVQSNIDLTDDVAVLLRKCKTDPRNARKYANLVLDIDPDNTEALSYL